MPENKEYIITEPTNYANSESWFRNDYDNPDRKDAKADVLYFNGTAVFKADQENGVGDIDEAMTNAFQMLYDNGVKLFDAETRMYIPYYRQISSEYAISCVKHNDLLKLMRSTEVRDDIFAALDYYFENYSDGRPFVIAGQSQGGAAVQIALEDYFGMKEHRPYLENMVAAYSVAYGVDKNWLDSLDYLKFAEGALDTGVVISWNTEGPGDKDVNFLLADNQADTLVINPINWKRDESYAEGSICISSLINGEIVSPGHYNLQIDLSRGSVICDNCEEYIETQTPRGALWGGKSLHTKEYALAFGSIRQNMLDRIEAFAKSEALKVIK